MPATIMFVTLAVDDLERSLRFYRDGLGWETDGIVAEDMHDDVTGADGTIVIFTLENGLMVSLYERTNLEKDSGADPGPTGGVDFSLGLAADSRSGVDEALVRAAEAGGRLHRRPHERPWGIYSGYFSDPDGHLWEVVHNPNE